MSNFIKVLYTFFTHKKEQHVRKIILKKEAIDGDLSLMTQTQLKF